ncbi:hypothetical protein [Salinisphaera sp. G21_0]|uniref:hypothetical protein n=1 Tax=Salinisphaera sp. G21_0 TaxID=2821094 RepID=UPI001ADAFDA0|nr:hypothetical protein [Salinisphaera sp. G21_0]MBO9480397.1 hypothetical protein [Salinisphaera sp. G21_0]
MIISIEETDLTVFAFNFHVVINLIVATTLPTGQMAGKIAKQWGNCISKGKNRSIKDCTGREVHTITGSQLILLEFPIAAAHIKKSFTN